MGKLALPALTWLAVGWVFGGPFFAGRVLYYRDVGVTYYPDSVFVAQALREGVWPLGSPAADADTPFLMAYPVHLLLLLGMGARATLALSPALHLLLVMAGTALLARRLGTGPWGAAWPARPACTGIRGWRSRGDGVHPPGFVVVLDGYEPAWTAEDRSGPVGLSRVFGRYRALPTPGGEQVFTLRFRPAWVRWGRALLAVGLLGLGVLARRSACVPSHTVRHAPCYSSPACTETGRESDTGPPVDNP
jgi:hypothetical protein